MLGTACSIDILFYDQTPIGDAVRAASYISGLMNCPVKFNLTVVDPESGESIIAQIRIEIEK